MLGWIILVGVAISVTIVPYLMLKQEYVPVKKRYVQYTRYNWATRRHDVIQTIEIK